MDLRVPVHRLPTHAAGRPALGIEAVGQFGDRLLKALREGREVLLVTGDQCRVGLGGKVVGKVKHAGGQRVHVIGSDLRSLATMCVRQGVWTGVTNRVAMTSNAPPGVGPVAVVGRGRQGVQVLVLRALAR